MSLVSSSLYVACEDLDLINVCSQYDSSPSFVPVCAAGTVSKPHQPCVDGTNSYFTESGKHRVMLYDGSSYTIIAGRTDGTAAATASDETEGAVPSDNVPSLNDPKGLFLVPHDGLYVADRGNNRVRKIILY